VDHLLGVGGHNPVRQDWPHAVPGRPRWPVAWQDGARTTTRQ
jgi:hypothetical protein